MSVLQNLLIKQMHERRSDFEPVQIVTPKVEFESVIDHSEKQGFQDLYNMRLSLQLSFWSSQAAYRQASAIAKQQLLNVMYADTLNQLDTVRHLIMQREPGAAIELLGKIKRNLTVEGE